MRSTVYVHLDLEENIAPTVRVLVPQSDSFSLDLSGSDGDACIFLTRKQLHQLRDLLNQACEEFPTVDVARVRAALAKAIGQSAPVEEVQSAVK